LFSAIVESEYWLSQEVEPWERPEDYILCEEKPESYDCDEEDLRFVEAYNRKWMGSMRAKQSRKDGPKLTEGKMDYLINKLEQMTGKRASVWEIVNLEEAKEELKAFPFAMIDAVYGYWYLKRLKLNRPLLRANMVPTVWDDTNPYLTFRARLDTPIARRKKLREDKNAQQHALKVHSRLVKGKEIVALLKDRETLKREVVVNEEALFDQEINFVKMRKIDQEDFLFRLQSGLWTMRNEVDDRVEQVETFRKSFPDPETLPEEEEREVRVEDLGVDLSYLSFVRRVTLPGITPFLGIPRLSRVGQVYYDCVGRDDVERLKERLVHDPTEYHPLVNVRLKSNPFVKMKLLIAMLNEMSTTKYEEEEAPDEEEGIVDSDEVVAELMGWEAGLLYEPPRLLKKMYMRKPESVVEKRRRRIRQ
jgi:hypothetical protein